MLKKKQVELSLKENIMLNYKEKLKNEIYKKRKGTKIMYALMELLLNRPKREKTFKINKRLDMLYSSQKIIHHY